MTLKKTVLFLTMWMMPFSLALGQAASTNGGATEGTITDPTGASIPGATIVISEPATGYTHNQDRQRRLLQRRPARARHLHGHGQRRGV